MLSQSTKDSKQAVVIIGAGPAGLMAAEVIARAGYAVEIYDAMPSVGRKFLLAGVGGMNITHAESTEIFLSRYGNSLVHLESILKNFGANELRDWVHGLGIETFVGSSGRVFPKEMKAAPLLRAWLHRLRELNVKIFPRHKWIGWNEKSDLVVETLVEGQCVQKTLNPSTCVLALGGASWQRLGSDGVWVKYLRGENIAINDLLPANCGFEISWSEKFKKEFSGAQLSSINLSVKDNLGINHSLRSEAIVTQYGIEGTGIYALSRFLRDQLIQLGSANLTIDLLPDWSTEKILLALQKPRGKNSISNFLRKQLNLSPVKMALLWEYATKAQIENPQLITSIIKNISLNLIATRLIDEAISTAGGIAFEELTSDLMLRKKPGTFCAGEMLDWEAPTGGYLLTACFATGVCAGLGVVRYLNSSS